MSNSYLPRRTFLLGSLAGLLLPGEVAAQPYPSNLIRIVVPTGAGTPPDIISRMVADGLAANEGWRLVVEDRPGALQTIAMNDVSGRPADGYALLTMSLPMTVTPSLLPKAETRPDVDFDPTRHNAFLASQYAVRSGGAAQEQAGEALTSRPPASAPPRI
jgi:tripartite-type tricarboxylate transporter receptor subunit TctC